MERAAIRGKLVERLEKVSLPKNRKQPIDDGTEIYYDLRVFGDDLYSFFRWIEKEFGVPLSVNLDEYAPREGMPPIFFRKLRERRERERRPYKSLKVGSVLAAVEAGRWIDTAIQ